LFKLPFFSKKRSASELELIRFIVLRFGYRPKEIRYFEKAVTHKSFAQGSELNSNERLEFLGDAVLDAVIAEYLFQRFPGEDEGYLTKLKSKIVSRKTLGEIAESMELRKVLRYNSGRSINLSTIEGNALEAMMGAIYLDGGFDAVKNTVHQHVFRKYVDLNRLLEEEIDFKSKLFIWCQRNKLNIEFRVILEENNGGTWNYQVVTLINEREYGRGTGSSKKSAEQVAAQETLQLMGEI
jgi:ribonuclease III